MCVSICLQTTQFVTVVSQLMFDVAQTLLTHSQFRDASAKKFLTSFLGSLAGKAEGGHPASEFFQMRAVHLLQIRS